MSKQAEDVGIIEVLVVVDVEGALASGNLQENVYLIDTNKHVQSGEGSPELKTVCRDGQRIRWSVAPVSASTDVEITGFTGQMVDDKICQPRKVTLVDGEYWEAIVESQQAQTIEQQYSVVLSMDGKPMEFDPHLEIQPA